jgi:lipopolysaccharide transport system ATP-binding protein
MRPIIKVKNLGKQYVLGARQAPYLTLRESIVGAVRAPLSKLRRNGRAGAERMWALRDVSFEVMPGEVVGIIGRNGAGKSTMLKILSRITEPTVGRVELYGRVGSLLEVGTGFHPELSGRENIYLNGSILGMQRHEIERKFDEIVAFAEVEKFLDTPVKRYSSGMYLRLAFAVAAHLEPEILMVDEVLAVGDVAFQERCLGKIQEVAQSGRTVLLVSHNMGAILRLCRRVLYFNGGSIASDGPAAETVAEYIRANTEVSGRGADLSSHPNATGEEARITAIRVTTSDGEPAGVINSDSPFLIEVDYEWRKSVPLGRLTIDVRDSAHQVIFVTHDDDQPALRGVPRKTGRYTARCMVPGFLLNSGDYYISVHVSIPGVKWCVQIDYVATFRIDASAGLAAGDGGNRPGVILPLLEWDTCLRPNVSPPSLAT